MTTSLDMIRGRSNIVTMTNNSGGALIAGDVCIQDTTADENVTTTTSAASTVKVFIAAESIGIGAAGKFYESGYCPFVNVSASATRGYFLFTHTVAKQATSASGYGSGAFGRVLKAGTTPSAIIYSATAQIGSSGVTRSGSTTDGNLAVWNGSSADSIKDGGPITVSAMVRIAQVAVGAGGAATIDFSSISASYTNLVLIGSVRGEKSATLISPTLKLNNDGGSNYDREYTEAFDTSVSAAGVAGASAMFIGNLPAANSVANYFGYLRIELPNYSNTTTYKAVTAITSETRAQTNAGFGISMVSGFWRSTAAIDRITLTPDSGNWAQYSTVTLYGMT